MMLIFLIRNGDRFMATAGIPNSRGFEAVAKKRWKKLRVAAPECADRLH
jgi:hypothetical protein